MIAHGSKEKLMQAFDQTQIVYEKWCEAKNELFRVEVKEREARIKYEEAKKNWGNMLKTCSPGDIEVEKEKSA